MDNSQRKAALEVIHKAERPLLFVYIHGWQNNATSSDVCRFEHFLDMVSSFPEFTGRKINVIGVYIAWRGKDLTVPGLKFLTFWSRKSTGAGVAAANSCLATIEELAVAAREPGKDYHHTVLLGHSFGALVLGNTISHSILGANGEGGRSSSAWDMAVAFNSADSSITTRQLMSEFDYLYKYDPQKRAYVSRVTSARKRPPSAKTARPWSFCNLRTIRQLDKSFPSGKGPSMPRPFISIGKKSLCPGTTAKKCQRRSFTPTRPATINTSSITKSFRWEKAARRRVCERLKTGPSKPISNKTIPIFHSTQASTTMVMTAAPVAMGKYSPGDVRPTGKELWRKWRFEYTGNARIPCWVGRVPKDIIWGHGGLWSDNSVAMFGALFRTQFPLSAEGKVATPKARIYAPAARTRRAGAGVEI